MNWKDKQVSLYTSHLDNKGRPATYRETLFSEFLKDIKTIVKLRTLNPENENYKKEKSDLKSKLHGFTPAALLETRAGSVISRTGMMQLDFDEEDIKEYDIEELKQCLFSLPFVCFCGLSCSGKGLYASVLIAEPERLKEYAQHCFAVLLEYGIKVDTSKGGNVNDFRYLSYDANMLIRENPEPLKIKHFKAQQPQKIFHSMTTSKAFLTAKGNTPLNNGLQLIRNVQVGNRWQTVQKVAYTLGGLNDCSILDKIKRAIESNASFTGEVKKYIKCADDCFYAGTRNLLK